MVADITMPKGLLWTFRLVDGGMLAYWSAAVLAASGIIHLPASFMYDGYGTPMVDAWNWSFAPLDVIFSILGLLSIRLAHGGNPKWRATALLSLALTFCAGLMAIAFWSLIGYFSISWWLPNMMLLALPLWWIHRLMKEAF
jgi:Family of unknown function (DUF5360)